MRQTLGFRGAVRRAWAAGGCGSILGRVAWRRLHQIHNFEFSSKRLPGALALVLVAAAVPAVVSGARADGRQVEAGPIGKAGKSYTGVIKRTQVLVKKSQVIEVDRPYATALLAEAEIADVVPLSDRSIYIVGKKVGSTRLTIIGENQSIVRIVEVDVTPDVDDLSAKLREHLPNAHIRVTSVNGGIMLTGAVHDAPTIERAMAIAKRYAPDAVTNALSVAAPQQVMLEVRFVEASRSAARELGIGSRGRGQSAAWDTGGQIANSGANTSTTGALLAETLLSGAAPFGTMLARILEGGTDVDVMIRALEQRSLARRLAEPNLVTTSGDTASFLAGGEFPFPVSAADNKITIEFKQFGVALAFTPTVLADSLINLKIAPEVSDIDPTNSVTVNNVRIPGLAVRRANTTVELKDGQSLAIAGLLQHTHTKEQSQLPWIGQVPVLGALFRSADFQKSESDLVIIVTPRLVKPKKPGELLATPLDGPVAANDADFFLNGRQEITQSDERRRDPKLYGHIIEPGTERVSHASAK
ncbi:MAG: type II and III secretion system protein family protein [Hyphomicrobium sp.]